ncbi:MAG: polysaccharide biosynthesis C-terminal domain-containing protein [Bacteroidota bacterium]
MGIIKRQSIKQSIVSYAAVGVAAISTVFIYPLEKEMYGLAAFILSLAQFWAPFILLGLNGVSIRFFPQFRHESKNGQGFLFFLMAGVAAGSFIFVLLWGVFGDEVRSFYEDRPRIYQQFFPHAIALAILMAFFSLLSVYASNFKRIVVPAIMQNLIRFSLPTLILLFYYQKVLAEGIVVGVVLTYVLALILATGYLRWLGELKWKPDFSWFTAERKREIRVYALFSLLGGLDSIFIIHIDNIMVSSMLDFQSNGAYAIAAFIGNAIAIPALAVLRITAPIISDSFRRNDLAHIGQLYKQTSINLLLAGLFLLICIVVSIEDLFSIMPKSEEMAGGFMIVLLIGLGRIIDMGASTNGLIISYSKYFKFSIVGLFALAAFNIIANYLFIPQYKIVGAALGTVGALAFFNLVKLIFIWWKFKWQPFTLQTVYLLIIAGTTFLLAWNMPVTGIAVVDMVLRSVLVALVYVPSIYYFKISEDVNGLIKNVLEQVRAILK